VACEIGKLAIIDLDAISHKYPGEKYYNGRSDQYHRDLLEACPTLSSAIPSDLKLATDEIFQRVSEPFSKSPVTIFDIEVPLLNAASNKATVRMGSRCNGLCSVRLEASYVLTRAGWKRQGEPRVIAVS
jgi:hypothetical protein